MRKLTSLLVLACLLAACSPDPDPGPPPATTPAATASSTTPSAAASNPSTDPLYLEAVEVYKAYFAEFSALEAAGSPGGKLPASLDRYITGPMKDAVADVYKQDFESGLRLRDNKPAVLSAIAPNPGVNRAGSLTSIRICSDASESVIVDREGNELGTGALVYKEIYFKRESGKLKGFISEAEEVSECPLQ